MTATVYRIGINYPIERFGHHPTYQSARFVMESDYMQQLIKDDEGFVLGEWSIFKCEESFSPHSGLTFDYEKVEG